MKNRPRSGENCECLMVNYNVNFQAISPIAPVQNLPTVS